MFENRQLSKEIKDLVQPLSPNLILTHKDMCNFMLANGRYQIAKEAFMNRYYLTRRV